MALPKLLRSPFRKQPPQIRQLFAAWLETDLGREIVAEQQTVLDELLPGIPGLRAAQLSSTSAPSMLDASVIPLRWTLAPCNGSAQVIARPAALPLAKRSLDLLVLHHCLDIEDNPHLVLREAVQALQPGGALVVVGFQPLGLWGLLRLFLLASRRPPWLARFLRPHRVSDWLQVLGCEVEGYESRFHNLPLAGNNARRRFRWLAWLGSHLWSQHGAFYVLVARKRAMMMRPKPSRFAVPGQVPNVIPVSMARWQRRDSSQEQS